MNVESCIEKISKIGVLNISTVDKNNCPHIRAISGIIFDNITLYFLTAQGKEFAKQMDLNPNIAISAYDLSDSSMIRMNGKVIKTDEQERETWTKAIYEKYPVLEYVYPGDTKSINAIYKLTDYTMEYFTLGTSPLTREYFEVGNAKLSQTGYIITESCIGCGTCQSVCPQKVIKEGSPFEIQQNNCLHCGNCFENCPVKAIKEL